MTHVAKWDFVGRIDYGKDIRVHRQLGDKTNQGEMRTAKRILQIFLIFASKGRPLTLSEIAAELYIPVSSCHRLMKALLEGGYVYSVGSKKHFYPTRRMLNDTLAIEKHDPVLHLVMPFLEALRDRVQETVLFAQASAGGDSVVFLAELEAVQLIRYTTGVGQTLPIYQAATGRALLSVMSKEERSACLSKVALPSPKKEYLAELEEALERGKQEGYQSQRGYAEVSSIAVPVILDGRAFAVGIAGPMQRMDSNLPELAAALKDCHRSLQTSSDVGMTDRFS